ncbi:glycosyltransferase family 9 protein [Ottowia thiooxydans]|uniref:glycosyltransferase family 9 protein n=1 Tax=Ottowia thiooxydans TaxID=219182 RepID=UPI00146E5B04|nr:glycosyltransferase family 9 protein [Ottowia thiooxydans]
MTQGETLQDRLVQALACIGSGQWEQADAACQNALALDPLNAEAHHLAGHVAGQLGQQTLGLALLQRAVELDPAHPQYRYNLAVTLQAAGYEQAARLEYRACLRQQPQHRDALWNYGEMLRLDEQFALALQHFERFEAVGGHYAALHHRMAVCCSALRLDDQARLRFERELNSTSDALTRWEYALFLLSREEFAAGFDQYRQRFTTGGRNSVYCHDFGLPLWPGPGSTTSGVLLVHGEQGLGDELMFASVVPELLDEAARTGMQVVLAVKPPLVRLFAASFPSAIVRAHRVGDSVADLKDIGPIDWQLPMGDLMAFYRRSAGDFSNTPHGYLRADPQRSAWYARQLALLEPPGAPAPVLRVGLMWGSNPAAVSTSFMRWSAQRSIPLTQMGALAAAVPKVRFVSLQNGERGAEAALAPELDIFDMSAMQSDFFETAALIDNLDLVISVDTSVSHLAGALNKETWVPLMHRCDWRHGLTRDHSLWYPHTRYFRQSDPGDWRAVSDALAQALQQRLAQAGTGE